MSKAKPTLAALAEEYVSHRERLGELTGRSPKVIASVLQSFAASVEGVQITKLNESHVEAWLTSTRLGPSSRRTHLSKLRPFVRWLVRGGYVRRDFAAGIYKRRLPDALPRCLSAEQVRTLVTAVDTSRDRLVVLTMAHLGLRCIEIARMDLDDVDLDERLLYVRGKNGLGHRTRALPIVDELHEALTEYLTETKLRSGPVFRSTQRPERGVTESWISEVVVGWMWRTGIKKAKNDGISAHALRHSCAQALIDRGVPIRTVQHVLGHKSVATTELYLRKKPPGVREALEGRCYTTRSEKRPGTPPRFIGSLRGAGERRTVGPSEGHAGN